MANKKVSSIATAASDLDDFLCEETIRRLKRERELQVSSHIFDQIVQMG